MISYVATMTSYHDNMIFCTIISLRYRFIVDHFLIDLFRIIPVYQHTNTFNPLTICITLLLLQKVHFITRPPPPPPPPAFFYLCLFGGLFNSVFFFLSVSLFRPIPMSQRTYLLSCLFTISQALSHLQGRPLKRIPYVTLPYMTLPYMTPLITPSSLSTPHNTLLIPSLSQYPILHHLISHHNNLEITPLNIYFQTHISSLLIFVHRLLSFVFVGNDHIRFHHPQSHCQSRSPRQIPSSSPSSPPILQSIIHSSLPGTIGVPWNASIILLLFIATTSFTHVCGTSASL